MATRSNRGNKNPAPAQTAPVAKEKRIKVRVKDGFMGYYDHARRREGDVFICDEKHFSDRWMERVDAATPEAITTAQTAIDKAHDQILAGNAQRPATAQDVEGL